MEDIAERVRLLRERIARAAERAGRDPGEIIVVAATKTRTPEEISLAIEAGIKVIGENRVQEAMAKKDRVIPGAEWHMIGHLQRNKVKRALEIFDLIQSVDSLRLAGEIDRRARELGRTVDIFVEVNTSGEETKFGVNPEEALDFVARLSGMEGLRIRGLMTVGAFLPDPEDVRPCFVKLRELSELISSQGIPGVSIDYLSMGMTNDFEIAIEEGANMVRVGTAIFGPRE